MSAVDHDAGWWRKVSPAARRRADQRGISVIEILVALLVLSFTIGGIAAATMTAGTTGSNANRHARLNVLATAFGEAIKALPYQTCASATVYQGLFDSSEDVLGDEAEDLRNATGATLEVVDVPLGPECPGIDSGVQTVIIRVSIGPRELERTVVKRTPEPESQPLSFDFEKVDRSGINDPQVVFGMRAWSDSPLFQYEWWCFDGDDEGNPEWVVGDAEPDVESLPEPPDFVTYHGEDPVPECTWPAPPEGTPEEDLYRPLAVRVTEAGTNRVGAGVKMVPIGTTLAPHNPPTAQITITSSKPCLSAPAEARCQYNTPISFASTGPDPVDGRIIQWKWNFGDGTPEVLCTSPSCKDQIHTFEGGGTFVVRLTVIDSFGMSGTTTRNVVVDGPVIEKPVVAPPGAGLIASVTAGVSAQTVTFDASGSHAAGMPPGQGITNYHWDFGYGGQTQSGANLSKPVFTYPASSDKVTYIVRVTVTANNGATNFMEIPITLDPLVPPINLRNSGARKADLPFIRNAYFDFQWTNVPRTPGDTIRYEIMISSSSGFCGGLGFGLNGKVFSVNANAAGTTQTYRAQFNSSPRGFNGVCSTDTYNFRSRTIRTNAFGSQTTNWSNPQTLDPEFF